MIHSVLFPQLSMTTETGVSKEEEEEEEDDAMQNTVVLFSNTDKFVLLQVTLSSWFDIFNSLLAFTMLDSQTSTSSL